MAYQYLTPEEQAAIVAEYQAKMPDPAKVKRDAEEEHFRQAIQAKMRGEDYPAYEAPDVKAVEAAAAVLDDEAAKLPAVEVIAVDVEV